MPSLSTIFAVLAGATCVIGFRYLVRFDYLIARRCWPWILLVWTWDAVASVLAASAYDRAAEYLGASDDLSLARVASSVGIGVLIGALPEYVPSALGLGESTPSHPPGTDANATSIATIVEQVAIGEFYYERAVPLAEALVLQGRTAASLAFDISQSVRQVEQSSRFQAYAKSLGSDSEVAQYAVTVDDTTFPQLETIRQKAEAAAIRQLIAELHRSGEKRAVRALMRETERQGSR